MDRRKRPALRLNSKKERLKNSLWEKGSLFYSGSKETIQIVKKVGMIAGILMIVLIPYYLWSSGYISQKIHYLNLATHHKIASIGFEVGDIMVEGRSLTSQKEILTVLNVRRHDSIFIPSLEDAKQKLETLPWVRSATVQRRLPDVLYVRLAERHPIAIWQNKNQMYLIDDRGNTLENPNLALPTGLLILTGEDAPKNASSLITALEIYPDITQRVTGAMFISRRRWDVIVDHKLKVKLSETDLKGSLESFWKLIQNHKLDDKEIVAVDLRFKDRAYFQLPPHIMERKKTEASKVAKKNV